MAWMDFLLHRLWSNSSPLLLCDLLDAVQVVGVSFLMLLKQQGIPGSILADEMGLGKTAQAICFLGMFIALSVIYLHSQHAAKFGSAPLP